MFVFAKGKRRKANGLVQVVEVAGPGGKEEKNDVSNLDLGKAKAGGCHPDLWDERPQIVSATKQKRRTSTCEGKWRLMPDTVRTSRRK